MEHLDELKKKCHTLVVFSLIVNAKCFGYFFFLVCNHKLKTEGELVDDYVVFGDL